MTASKVAEIEEAIEWLMPRASALCVILSEEQKQLLSAYCEQLADYNSHTNLVSDASPKTLVADHILDSLSLVKYIDDYKQRQSKIGKNLRLIDIGSGAGLPGMILGIVLPYLEVTLVDSIGKKVRFLEAFVESRGLNQRIHPICERAEELGHHKQYRERFDLATGRAAGSFDLIAELAIPLLRKNGELFSQKSQAQLEESTHQAAKTLPKLGSKIRKSDLLDANILGKERAIIVIEKLSPSAATYPRSWAQMKTSPLGS